MAQNLKIQIWEATKVHYAHMKPQDSVVKDSLDEERYWKTAKPFGSTAVKGFQADCVDVAISMKSRGLNPLLMNMASIFQPGKGVWKGTGAQEEELFLRSNYFKHLHRHFYLLPPLRTIVSRGVEFYRASASKNYDLLPILVAIDCVAVAELRKPERTADLRRFKHARDAELLTKKTTTSHTGCD